MQTSLGVVHTEKYDEIMNMSGIQPREKLCLSVFFRFFQELGALKGEHDRRTDSDAFYALFLYPI